MEHDEDSSLSHIYTKPYLFLLAVRGDERHPERPCNHVVWIAVASLADNLRRLLVRSLIDIRMSINGVEYLIIASKDLKEG